MNNSAIIFIAELTISLGVSVAVLYLLQPVLYSLLREICRGETRASFWATFTRLMLLISPLLVVILFSHTMAETAVSFTHVFRDALLHALLGQFVGLLIVGGILISFSKGNECKPGQIEAWCDTFEEPQK